MPRAIRCRLNGEVIDVGRALALREQAAAARRARPDFRCVGCGERVRAHRTGTTGQEAHFEHLRGNPRCRLSDFSDGAR